MSDLVENITGWILEYGGRCRGQTLVEYSLILAFIASMIVALAIVVGGTNGLLDSIQSRIVNALT